MLLNVKLYVSPGAMVGLAIVSVFPTIVWATVSLFVHVTVSPFLMIICEGLNEKFLMETVLLVVDADGDVLVEVGVMILFVGVFVPPI